MSDTVKNVFRPIYLISETHFIIMVYANSINTRGIKLLTPPPYGLTWVKNKFNENEFKAYCG